VNAVDQQTVSAGNSAVARAHEVHSAANNLAHSLRMDGLMGPADAYQILGYMCLLTKTTHDVMSLVVESLRGAQRDGVLTVAEGPFEDEPEAALAVVADAVACASAASARSYTELERAHIAAADISALRRPGSRRAAGEHDRPTC
jgi:hypothetical protein